MRVVRFEDLEEYLPAGHKGVVNRLLVGRANGGDGTVSVWHGHLDPGGQSDIHAHEESLQIYVGLSGDMIVGNDDSEHILGQMTTAVIGRGARHFIANRSDGPAEVLVISVPGLR